MASERAPLRNSARWLLTISGLFALSVALSNTFVNVYLWKVDKSFTSIGCYNLALYMMIPFMFLVSGYVAKRKNPVWTLRLGILFHVCFYALTLIGGRWIAGLPILLGVLMGAAAGFYWCSFNELSLRFTDSGSRDRFYGMNGVVASVSGMIAPPVAGFLISMEDRFGGLSGYHWVFGLSLSMFLLAGLTTTRIHAKSNPGRLSLQVVKRAFGDRVWRGVLFGSLVYGLREGLFMFLIGLLMYIATGSELELGEFLLLQSALSFVSFFIIGRIVHAATRIRILGIGAMAMGACALIFLLPLRAVHLLWYGAAIAICLPAFLVPLQGMVFDTIGRLNKAREDDAHTEHIITREFFSNSGRVLGIVVFLIWVQADPLGSSIPYLAVAFGFVQIVTWLIFRRAAKSSGGNQTTYEQSMSPASNRTWSGRVRH